MVTYGTAGQCIIDREQRIRLAPKQDYRIERMPADGGTIFCVWEKGYSFKLLDGETLELLAEYLESNGYIAVDSINASIYRVVRSGENRIGYYSTYDFMERFFADASIQFDGNDFCHYQNGAPTRLVAQKGNHKMYLTDLMGRKIEGTEYNRITPLVWEGNDGVYLVEVYDVPADDWDDHYPMFQIELEAVEAP